METRIRKPLLSAIGIVLSLVANAAVPDSIKQNLEDFDYLTCFIEKNHAAFPAIVAQERRAREYDAMKDSIRGQLGRGEKGIERGACDYVFWFYSKFDTHFSLKSGTLFGNEYRSKTHPQYWQFMTYEPKPVASKVDSSTFLIRVPSCVGDNVYSEVAEATRKYQQSGCANLIIDIRGNRGGSDGIWAPVYKMLKDHKVSKPEIHWVRNTPKNIAVFEQALERNGYDGYYLSFLSRCKLSSEEFVKWAEEDGGNENSTVSKYPVKAAVLIDRWTASAAESLVRFVKNFCDPCRTQIYGKDNTYGCAHTGNCSSDFLPHSKLFFSYPTSVDQTFIDNPGEGHSGISPDVRIGLPYPTTLTDNIDEWVLWVAKELEKA